MQIRGYLERTKKRSGRNAYLGGHSLHRGVEQPLRRRVFPALEVWGEFGGGDVAKHRSHGDIAFAP